MKIMELQNEEALDALADLIDPAIEILGDPQVKVLYAKKDISGIVKHIIKNHKKAIIEVLAVADMEDPKEYKCSILTLPNKIIELLNEKELIDFFSQYAPAGAGIVSFGDATQNIEASE